MTIDKHTLALISIIGNSLDVLEFDAASNETVTFALPTPASAGTRTGP